MFAIHRENRNLFAHTALKPTSTIEAEPIAVALKMTARSHIKQSIIEVRVDDIREVADEILVFRLYVAELRGFLLSLSQGRPYALPNRPAQPRSRNQLLPQSLLNVLLQP